MKHTSLYVITDKLHDNLYTCVNRNVSKGLLFTLGISGIGLRLVVDLKGTQAILRRHLKNIN